MSTRITALQLARVPALLILLFLTAWPTEAHARSIVRFSTEAVWGPWALVVLVSLVFVVVALAGRLRWHPWAVLVLEALAAGVVALVPPLYWLLWMGVGGAWATAMTGGLAQPLAITWLGVVGLRVYQQVRGVPDAGSPAPRSLDVVSTPTRSEQT